MLNSIFDKINKRNNNSKVASSKKRDIKLATVNKANENQLELVLSENQTIDHIYAVKDVEEYEMPFTQSGRSIYLDLSIPAKLLLDSDEKLDVYFTINRTYFRPYWETADNVSSKSRHFDVFPGLRTSAYIYFSKKYKRAMLQVKKMQNMEFKELTIEDNKVNLLFNNQASLYNNYSMVLERWGKYAPLQTSWHSDRVTGVISRDIEKKLAVGFGYSIRLINTDGENVPIGINVKNSGKIQIAKNDKGEVLPFEWDSIHPVKKYGKIYLQYPKDINIDAIYLEYKERQVYREVEFQNYGSNGWLILNINLDEAATTFKGIHTIYQKDNTKISRSYNELAKVEKVEYLPNLLNVIVTSNNNKTQLHLENDVYIVSVSLRAVTNKLWNKYDVNETIDVVDINATIVSFDLLVIEYLDANSIVQNSVFKVDDIYVGVI